MAKDFNRVCTGWWVQGWFGQLHEKLHLDVKKIGQYLKIASTKLLVGVKTSLKINVNVKSMEIFITILKIVNLKIKFLEETFSLPI